MNFTFELNSEMRFGFKNIVPEHDNTPKIPCGNTEIQPDGTTLFAAGKTIIIEEETV